MKTLNLVSHVDDRYTFVYIDVKEKLPEYENILKDSIKDYKVFTIDKMSFPKLSGLAKKVDNLVNFSMKGGKVVTESRMTRDLLKEKCFTCIAICSNLQGERLGLIISDIQGKLYTVSMKNMIDQVRTWKALNNMFLRNGKELVLNVGNYSKEECNVPVIALGTKLKGPKIRKAPEVNSQNLGQFKAPIRAMINDGFKQYCDQFGLYNRNYPEETLWFYYQLMKNGEINIIGNMLRTEPFELEQLIEIARGLRNGINVKVYADPSISVNDMIKARVEQERGTFVEMPMPKKLKEMEEEAKRTNNEKLLKKISMAKEALKKSVSKKK